MPGDPNLWDAPSHWLMEAGLAKAQKVVFCGPEQAGVIRAVLYNKPPTNLLDFESSG